MLLHNGDSWNVCVTKRCLFSTVQNNLSDNGFYPTSFPTWEISSPAYIQPHSLFSWSSEHPFPVLDRMKCFKRPVSCYWSFKPVSVFSFNFFWSSEPTFPILDRMKCFKRPAACYWSFKGTQDWEFSWLRFWNLRYFFVSYVKILRFYQKFFLIGPLLGELRFFRKS